MPKVTKWSQPKVHMTKQYVRYRINNPNDFDKKTIRTQDIGRKGHSKRLGGINKKTGEWETQAILITREDYAKGTRVKKVKGRPVIIKSKWYVKL